MNFLDCELVHFNSNAIIILSCFVMLYESEKKIQSNNLGTREKSRARNLGNTEQKSTRRYTNQITKQHNLVL
jgi:hypothetical protein